MSDTIEILKEELHQFTNRLAQIEADMKKNAFFEYGGNATIAALREELRIEKARSSFGESKLKVILDSGEFTTLW